MGPKGWCLHWRHNKDFPLTQRGYDLCRTVPRDADPGNCSVLRRSLLHNTRYWEKDNHEPFTAPGFNFIVCRGKISTCCLQQWIKFFIITTLPFCQHCQRRIAERREWLLQREDKLLEFLPANYRQNPSPEPLLLNCPIFCLLVTLKEKVSSLEKRYFECPWGRWERSGKIVERK